MRIEIRPLTPLDAPLLEEMAKIIFTASWERPWRKEEFEQLLVQPAIFGWLTIQQDHPNGYILIMRAGDDIEIITLGVLPTKRRQGMGRILMRTLTGWAKEHEINNVHLELAQDNLEALSFYRTMGFTLAGKRPHYYRGTGKSVDALRMSADPRTLSCSTRLLPE